MNTSTLNYRNLAELSDQQWQQLDIYTFIAQNFNRYCTSLIKKIGPQYLPSDAPASLMGMFCDVAYTPLKRVHQKNLPAQGDRRNQIMLGTLKKIAQTRMVDALIKEYPNYITIEQLPEFNERDDLDHYDGVYASTIHSAVDLSLSNTAMFAAQTSDLCEQEQDREKARQADRLSLMVENLRSHLTPVQYRHIRYAVCDGLNSSEIAERTGHSVTNVRIMLLNARKRMLELVPSELSASVQECLHRK